MWGDDLFCDWNHVVEFLEFTVVLDDVERLSLVSEGNDIWDWREGHVDFRSSGDGGEVETLFGLAWLEFVLRWDGWLSDWDSGDGWEVAHFDWGDVSAWDFWFVGSLLVLSFLEWFVTFEKSGDGEMLDVVVEAWELVDTGSDSLGDVEHFSSFHNSLGTSGVFQRISNVGSGVGDESINSGWRVVLVEDDNSVGVWLGNVAWDSLRELDVVDWVVESVGLLLVQVGFAESGIELSRFDSVSVFRRVDDHIVWAFGSHVDEGRTRQCGHLLA